MVGSLQGIEVLLALLRLGRHCIHRWEPQAMDQRDKEHTTDSPIEVTEGVNPLKPPVSPGKKFGEASECTPTPVTQPLG